MITKQGKWIRGHYVVRAYDLNILSARIIELMNMDFYCVGEIVIDSIGSQYLQSMQYTKILQDEGEVS